MVSEKWLTQITMWAFTLMTIASACLTFYFLFTGEQTARTSSTFSTLCGLGLVILTREHLDNLNGK